MRLKICFRCETFFGFRYQMIRCGRSNAVSFVKTQNMQTLFFLMHFRTLVFVADAKKCPLLCSFCVKTVLFQTWIEMCFVLLTELMVYLKTRVLSRVLLFFNFFYAFGILFLFQENAFLLFSQEKKAAKRCDGGEFEFPLCECHAFDDEVCIRETNSADEFRVEFFLELLQAF